MIVGSVKKALKTAAWWAGGLSLAEREVGAWSKPATNMAIIVQKGQGPCHGPTIRGSSQSWG